MNPSNAKVAVLAALQLAIVGYIDYVTGFEVSLAIFYFAPIAYAAWSIGPVSSALFAIASAATLTWAEVAGGRSFSRGWMVWEHTLMRVLVFGFVAFSFSFFRRALRQEQDKVRHLEGAITFCSCCHKVRDEEGHWTALASFLRETKGVESEGKLCPTCAREVYATAESRRQTAEGGMPDGGRNLDAGGQTDR